MLYPSIDKMATLVDSKYTLVVAAAKRARRLEDGAKPKVQVPTNKNVTVALNEISSGAVLLVRATSAQTEKNRK